MTTAAFLGRLVRYRPGLYALVLLLNLAMAALNLVPGFLTKAFFDALTEGAAVRLDVPGVAALVVAVSVASVVLVLGTVAADTRFRFTASTLVHHNLLLHVLRRPGARALPCSPGEAMNHFRDDVEAVQRALRAFVNDVVLFLSTVAGLAVMLSISPPLTLAVLVPFGLVGAISRLLGKPIESRRNESRKATARYSGTLAEVFGGIQAIQIANAQGRILRHFERVGEERKRSVLRDVLLGTLLEASYASLASLSLGSLLLVGARVMGPSQFSVGDFSLFVYLTQLGTGFTARIGGLVADYRRTGVSVRRLAELLQGESPETLVAPRDLGLRRAAPEPPAAIAPPRDRFRSLAATGLTYAYPGEATAGRGIVDVGLTVRRGEIVVITGRIGSGKTTLLRVLLGLLPRQAGEIAWNGEAVADPASFFTPPRTAYTAQASLLFSESVRDNILMGLPEDAVDLPGRFGRRCSRPTSPPCPRASRPSSAPRGCASQGGSGRGSPPPACSSATRSSSSSTTSRAPSTWRPKLSYGSACSRSPG